MTLSSAAAWAVLSVEFPKVDVGWREGRVELPDAGLDGDVLEAALEREKGLLDGGTPVGLSGEGVKDAEDAVRTGRCCCKACCCASWN
jgi:hypothetical protein